MASQKSLLDKSDREKLKEKLAISNFDPNAILRGAQLTIVGGKLAFNSSTLQHKLTGPKAIRALRNPDLFTSDHYKQAAIAVALGIIIRLAIEIPVWPLTCLQTLGTLLIACRFWE